MPSTEPAGLRHVAGLDPDEHLPAPDRFLPVEQLPRALFASAEELTASAEDQAVRAEQAASDARAALARSEELVEVVQRLVADLRDEDHGARQRADTRLRCERQALARLAAGGGDS